MRDKTALLLLALAVASYGCSDDASPVDARVTIESNACATCLGCCAGGQCLPGNTISACGSAGLTCTTCLSTDECLSGVCVPAGTTCTPTTCADGCCTAAGACMRPSASEACGVSGAACSRCGTTEICFEGRCQLAQGERYALRIYSAVIDSFCDLIGPCDPYAELALGDGTPITVPTLDDTDTPQWDFKVLEASLADLTRLPLTVVIMDDDNGFDGTIGECTLHLDSAQVTSGSWTGPCGDDVPELVLHFNAMR